MSITTFFKKRHIKSLRHKIYQLQLKSAKFKQSAEIAKYSADETSKFISNCQHRAEMGALDDQVYLSCYLHDQLEELDKYNSKYTIANQKYLILQSEIAYLEDELNKLQSSL